MIAVEFFAVRSLDVAGIKWLSAKASSIRR